jgi:hypothetical protein
MKQKTGGRQKGTPNRTTAEIREKYQSLIEGVLPQLENDLKALEPKDRIKVIIELSKFVVPTLRATEIKTDDPTDNLNKITVVIE